PPLNLEQTLGHDDLLLPAGLASVGGALPPAHGVPRRGQKLEAPVEGPGVDVPVAPRLALGQSIPRRAPRRLLTLLLLLGDDAVPVDALGRGCACRIGEGNPERPGVGDPPRLVTLSGA